MTLGGLNFNYIIILFPVDYAGRRSIEEALQFLPVAPKQL